MEGFFNTAGNRLLSSLVLLMAIIALGSYAMLNFGQLDHLDPIPATISVAGEGEVLAVPDIGQFSFSVMAEADTAAEAQELSGTKINDILAYLREQGVAETDIKTESYNLFPRYRWEERVCPAGSFCPPGERVADGFEVSQTIAVKVRETDAAAGIIAGVGERGATNISGLNFTVDDTDALRADARAEAIADAETKAKVLADQLGVRLMKVVSFYEEDGKSYEPYMRMASLDADESAGFGGADLPVGEESTTVRVTVTYEIK